MTRKGAIFYTFLFCFITTFAVTILGIIDVIKIRDGYLNVLFGSLILELVAAVVTLFKGTSFFDDDKLPGPGSKLTIAENRGDEDAKFALIDSMADEVESQIVILMHELKKDVSRYSSYIYETDTGSGKGSLSPFTRGSRLEGSGLVRVSGNGGYWSLTDEGHRFAEWLLSKGRKHSYFWTPAGGWGTPKPGGSAEKYIAEKQSGE